MTNTHPHPARQIRRRPVESSAVVEIAWDDREHMWVEFVTGSIYMYDRVPYQRAVACARAESVGKYVSKKIVPVFEGTRIR